MNAITLPDLPDLPAPKESGTSARNAHRSLNGGAITTTVREIARAAPKPLPSELHPVPPFDLALLPDSLRPWITDVCERVQCPPDFVAVPVMVALGTLIGRKVRIRPKDRDSWSVVPNVWGCLIGRPGTMKSPAVGEALRPLRRIEVQAREEYDALYGDYESQVELAKLRRDAAKDTARKILKKAGGTVSAD